MILAVIPARGGSERVRHKNLQPVHGRPLLAWTLDAALDAGMAPHVVVSTDSLEIAGVAREEGVDVVDRPAELASSTASTEGVLLHALAEAAAAGRTYEWVVTLPPTSPLRSAATVRQFLDLAAEGDADCYFSVHEHRGDFWVRDDDGASRRLFPDAPRRQQDRRPLLEENSAVYVTRVQALQETGSILGRRPEPVVIPAREGFDINTADDLLVAAALMAAT